MKYRKRIYYTAEQRSVMWDYYQRGESLHTIARLFDRYHSSVARIISEAGGIRPVARKRSETALSLSEREEISRGIAMRLSIRSIAEPLQRSPFTISREISRSNGGYDNYRANKADQAAWDRAKRPRLCKLRRNKHLRSLVAKKLKINWSPQPRSVVLCSGCVSRMASLNFRNQIIYLRRNIAASLGARLALIKLGWASIQRLGLLHTVAVFVGVIAYCQQQDGK